MFIKTVVEMFAGGAISSLFDVEMISSPTDSRPVGAKPTAPAPMPQPPKAGFFERLSSAQRLGWGHAGALIADPSAPSNFESAMSPHIQLWPELSDYSSLDATAFCDNSNHGIAPDKSYSLCLSGDLIAPFQR
jgi:hypothetical protein